MNTSLVSGFPTLPLPVTTAGAERLCGVEIEFAGLDEQQTADVITRHLGGQAGEPADHEITVKGTEIGAIKVELDTALRKMDGLPLANETLDLVRGLVPVEIVSEPLTRENVGKLSALCAPLRHAGAIGSRGGVLFGFGVHLNPECVALDHPHTLATIRAFALLEHWIRHREKIDTTRRLLPFVEPWPTALVTALASDPPSSFEATMRLAATHVSSRNHGLDLFPLFKAARPRLFAELFGDDSATSARPAFHFRLPESRIDEDGWSLAPAWRHWWRIETLAANASGLDRVAQAWLHHDEQWLARRHDWTETVDDLMRTIPDAAE